MWSTLESGTRVDFILHVLKKKKKFLSLPFLPRRFLPPFPFLSILPFVSSSLRSFLSRIFSLTFVYGSSLASILTPFVSVHTAASALTLPQLRTRAQFFDNTAF